MVTGCGAALCEPTLTAGDARVDEHKGVWPLLAMQGHARRDEVPPRREAHRHDGPSVGVPPRLAYGSWEAAESATSAGPHGRTAASSHWALSALAAASPCVAQPEGQASELWHHDNGHADHAEVRRAAVNAHVGAGVEGRLGMQLEQLHGDGMAKPEQTRVDLCRRAGRGFKG